MITPPAPRPQSGIVHLGLGAFFRAHAALYIQEVMARHGGDWGVIGVSLRSPATRNRLRPQNWAYTAAELGPAGLRPQRVSVLNNVLVAPEAPEAVLDAMAQAQIKIVSLTVTEKGYCLTSATGGLDLDHPDIQHDIAAPLPRSAPGFLVRALQRRKARGLRPFTVLPLDNLPNNGAQIRAAVLRLAQEIDPNLHSWIAAEARFPATMVDRIVPATTPDLIAQIAEITGEKDAAPVGHEPFRQWVIEDKFVDGNRPDFDSVGAQFVQDVRDFEHMKLRMLNGTHSALAYLGALAGFRDVATASADPVIAAFLSHLWAKEIIPTLAPPPGVDLDRYATDLLTRYQNPAIAHQLEQIAMDGSQKLPQRIVATLSENLKAGRDIAGCALVLAGWLHFLRGKDEAGAPLEVSDPLLPDLRKMLKSHTSRDDLVAHLLGMRAVFGAQPPAALAPALSKALKTLETNGALVAMRALTG